MLQSLLAALNNLLAKCLYLKIYLFIDKISVVIKNDIKATAASVAMYETSIGPSLK
jgi:hypothetical protein